MIAWGRVRGMDDRTYARGSGVRPRRRERRWRRWLPRLDMTACGGRRWRR